MIGITAIKKFVNRTGQKIEIRKRENFNDMIQLKPHWESMEEIWIPWVVSEQEFDDKVLEVYYEQDDRRVFIWQIGDKVKFSNFGFDYYAKPINGVCKADGDRMLIIDNNSVTLELLR